MQWTLNPPKKTYVQFLMYCHSLCKPLQRQETCCPSTIISVQTLGTQGMTGNMGRITVVLLLRHLRALRFRKEGKKIPPCHIFFTQQHKNQWITMHLLYSSSCWIIFFPVYGLKEYKMQTLMRLSEKVRSLGENAQVIKEYGVI